MNIKVDVDITPQELRRLMGLPDVEPFNRELMDSILEKMKAGVEGYDPLSLFQPYMTTTMAGMDVLRKIMNAAMTGFNPASAKKSEKQSPPSQTRKS